MYPQRQIYPYQLGFPVLPQMQQRTAYNQGAPGSVSTGPAQQQQRQSPLSTLSGPLANAALRQYFNQPTGYTGAQSLAATDAADASSPYASNALLANGADPQVMAQLASGTPYEATPAMGEGAESGLGLLGGDTATGTAADAAGTAAGSTAAGTAAGTAAAEGAAAGTAADTSLAASGLLGADAAGTGLAGAETAGLLGGGAAAGEGAAAATAAGEGTAAAVGATNFWNPVGWAALAGLAAYQLGLFD